MGWEQSPAVHQTGLLSWQKIVHPPQHIDNAHIGSSLSIIAGAS